MFVVSSFHGNECRIRLSVWQMILNFMLFDAFLHLLAIVSEMLRCGFLQFLVILLDNIFS